jgi:hypothetical protein
VATVSKISKANEYNTIETIPSELKTFGTILQSEKPTKTGQQEFLLFKNKDTQFIIKTINDAEDLADYKGFLEVYVGSNKIFAGLVVNLRREGFGVEFDSGRVVYRGEFSNNLYHGWGQTVRYQGEFKCGRKEGWGRWEDSGFFYEGSFKDDKFHGIGYLNLHSKQVEAFMTQEATINPLEKVAKRYAGEWASGRMQGSGKLITKEELYQGGFSEGAYSGDGVLTRAGKVTLGKFHKGAAI